MAHFLDEDDPDTDLRQFVVSGARDADGTVRGQTLIDIEGPGFSAALAALDIIGLSGGGFAVAWVENVSTGDTDTCSTASSGCRRSTATARSTAPRLS